MWKAYAEGGANQVESTRTRLCSRFWGDGGDILLESAWAQFMFILRIHWPEKLMQKGVIVSTWLDSSINQEEIICLNLPSEM